jgi:hypothetical protein
MKDAGDRRAALVGAILGALSGASIAVVYRRWQRLRRRSGAQPIRVRQVVPLASSVLTVVRQFLDLVS